jgi:hypothetical protein
LRASFELKFLVSFCLAVLIASAGVVYLLVFSEATSGYTETIDLPYYREVNIIEVRKVEEGKPHEKGELIKEIKDSQALLEFQAWLSRNQTNWCYACSGASLGTQVLHLYRDNSYIDTIHLNLSQKSVTLSLTAKSWQSKSITEADVIYLSSLIAT